MATPQVLNFIWGVGSPDYQRIVPQATATNIAKVGEAVNSSESLQNEFCKNLVNKVCMQGVNVQTFNSPLAFLKKGLMPLGTTYEDIYINPAEGEVYDDTGASLLSRVLPDAKTLYYRRNRQDKFKASISEEQLLGAFVSYDAFGELVSGVISSLYSGDNIAEFILMKNMVTGCVDKGYLPVIEVDDPFTSKANAEKFVKTIRTTSSYLTFPSTSYNGYNLANPDDTKPVTTWTPKDRQVFLVRADVMANNDVDVLAQAFNVDKATFIARTVEIDTFGNADIYGIICDEGFFQVRDNMNTMRSFDNGEGLYRNYIWHHWQTFGARLFANAVVLKKKATA